MAFRKFYFLLASLVFLPGLVPVVARAQTAAINGACSLGAAQATVSGLKSANYQLGIIPSCTVRVFLTGTTNLATIYADNNNTALANPFTATPSGQWIFFALINQGYDVVLDGGVTPNVYPAPVTLVALYPAQQVSTIPGPPGPANALTAGPVTNLPFGTPATATITGTPPNQTLALGIPAGSPGTGNVTGQANGVIPLATGAAAIGAQSHLDDGVTTPATITASEPMNVATQLRVAGVTTSGQVAGQASGFIPLGTSATNIGGQAHIDDGVTAASTLTMSEALNAPVVNTVYDLKAKFGASGSQQTMTCTATGGSSVLTGCTGGDFTVGQWVFLPSLGQTATITTPVAPTLTCVSHSGGNCTGTTVYGYKIVAVQGLPNGALTPAGPAQTITQGTQIMSQIGNSGNPDVGTTVTWSAITNTAFYYIYKSINGGAYNFYTRTGGPVTTVTDYGGMSSAGLFTCLDDAAPCTAPSTSTPNDVYAQITAINGGTVTIAAPASVPKFYIRDALNAETVPTQPIQSGTVIVQHDDTPAFVSGYAYIAALQSKGTVELHIPSGNFNVHMVNPYGSQGFFFFNALNNFALAGNGNSSKIYGSADRSNNASAFFGDCGFTTISPPGGCVSYGPLRGSNGPSYSVVDPVNAGQHSVTLTTPSDASNFPVGKYVTLGGTGTPYPADTYGELNLVTGSDATTGIVTLAYPTNKTYSVTLPAIYSTGCANCAAAPKMGPVTPNPTATHIKLKNFWFRGDVRFLTVTVIDDLEESGLTVLSNGTESANTVRHRLFTNNDISEDGFFNSQSFLANAAQGSGDYIVTNNSYTTLHGANTGQACSEGSVNEVFANNTYSLSGNYQNPAGNGAFMGMGWGCWGETFTNNNVTINNDAMQYVIASNDGGGSAIFTGNQFNIDSISASGSALGCVQPQALLGKYSKAFNNNWSITNGASNTCYKQTGNAATLASVDALSVVGSANFLLYPYYGSQTVLNYTLTANVNTINLGQVRIPGYLFMINFIQDATGGHWLPLNCNSATWGVTVDCINGTPIQVNLAPNANTFVWFYDDGTIVHELWTSQPSTATYSTFTTPSLSGNIVLYPYYPLNAKILNVPITGNITQVNMTGGGGRHAANAYFGIAFIQDATGGRTLPADCLEAHWTAYGNGIDCPAGPPVANPAANSITYLWFYDDGTNIHFLSENYTKFGLPSASDTKDTVQVDGSGTGSILTPATTGTWEAAQNGGADNTGAVDASAILNAKTTALCSIANPQRIHLSTGTYTINSGWLISATSSTCKGIVIEGDGSNNTILQTNCSGHNYGIWYNNTTNSGEHYNGPTIRHLQIKATGGTACAVGLQLTQTAGFQTEDLLITGFTGSTYSTGTIASTGSTVNCTGCTFTAAMVHGFIEATSGTTTTRAEICSFTSGTQIGLCSTGFPTGNIAGGTSFALAYGGDGLVCDGGFSYTQYGTIKDVYAPGNLIGIHAWGSTVGGCSRITVVGDRDYIAPNLGTRVTDSVGIYLGKRSDTWTISAPVNNSAVCFVLESAHANRIYGKCEDNATYAPVTTCNGGVATQNCTQGLEVSSESNGAGWGNQYNDYGYLMGTVFRFDNATGAYQGHIMGDQTLSGQYTTHYDFYGSTGCPGNASGIPAIVTTYDCNHQLVAQTVN